MSLKYFILIDQLENLIRIKKYRSWCQQCFIEINCAVTLTGINCAVTPNRISCAVPLTEIKCAVLLIWINCEVPLTGIKCAVLLIWINCAVPLTGINCAVLLIGITARSHWPVVTAHKCRAVSHLRTRHWNWQISVPVLKISYLTGLCSPYL